ncbi:MAG: bifunctional UDP-sugar hydrolase/5'-nucleotidase [Synergistota bacterium]|nr:bifunctional UDP-sugar hydrolase/5'-nucleotidase [Synergistota bacterium]
MKGFRFRILSAGLMLLLLLPLSSVAEERTATILFFADLKSRLAPVSIKANKTTVQFGGLVNGAALLRSERGKNPATVVLAGGDSVSGLMWHTFAGTPEFSAMEEAGVQAVLLGNHEFHYGSEHLKKALSGRSMHIIASNLSFADEMLAEIVKRWTIIEAGGIRLGVFGLASPTLMTENYPVPGVDLDDDIHRVTASMVDELGRNGAEVILALSRLQREDNSKLASSVDGIHAILGSSSHKEAPEPSFVKNPGGWDTVLADVGDYLAFVGRLDLTVRQGKLSRNDVSWRLLGVTPQAGVHEGVQKIALEYERRLNEAFLIPMAVFDNPVDGKNVSLRSGENALGNLIADSLRLRFRTDIGMVNGGGVRGDRFYPAGSVSWRTFHEMLPYSNKIYVVTLTGEQIKQLLEFSASALKGGPGDNYDPALRPPTGAFLQVSGLRVRFSLEGEPSLVDWEGKELRRGSRLKDVSVLNDGEWVPLDDSTMYTIAINSYAAEGGDKLSVFTRGPFRDTGVVDVDALVEHIVTRPGSRVTFATDGRIAFED